MAWITEITRLNTAETVASISDQTDDGLSTFGEQWTDRMNDAGPFRFSMWANDPDLPLIAVNDSVRFIDNGVEVFGGVIESITEERVARDEEAGQLWTFAGRQRAAALSWARTFPWFGVGRLPVEEDRLFNWTSPPFDDSTWIGAGEILTVDAARAGWPVSPIAIGFPLASGAYMIWDAGANATDAAAGECFFRRFFNVSAGRYVLVTVADNLADFYIDAQILGTVQQRDGYGFVRASLMPITLSAGDHVLAIRGENLTPTVPGSNPAAVAYALYEADDANQPTGDPVIVSDSSTLVYGYPDYPPGMPIGQAIRILVAEAQDRGVIPFVNVTFNDLTDTNGNDWPTGDLSTKTGTDLLTVLQEWAVTYIDFSVTMGADASIYDLNCYRKGEMGTSSGVTLAPAPVVDNRSGNLVQHRVLRQ